MDFNKVKQFQTNINTNQKNYTLSGKARQIDISLNKQIFKTILLNADIARRDKNPYHKSTITMVLLGEKEKIPLLIKVFASGILIHVRLIEIK